MKILILALFALVLTACGGSGSDSSSSTSSSNISNFSLSFSAVKSFDFTWTDSSDATYYKLMENQDGNSGFTQVGSNISSGTQTYSHIVPLYARMNAQYILQGCNDAGCTDSDTISVDDTLVDSVGYVKASNTDTNDYFSDSISLSSDGSTLAVSSSFEASNSIGINGDQTNNDSLRSGAVYVFTQDESNIWSQQAYIKSSNSETSDSFGSSISLSADGNTLVVGAPLEDSNATGIDGNQSDNSYTASGAVYVFTRNSNNDWSQQAYLKASNTQSSDSFGGHISLSGDGNTLAVGASGEDSNALGINGDQNNDSALSSGAIYLFVRNNYVWSQQAYLKSSNSESYDYFGYRVALSSDGNTLAAGAYGEDSNAQGVDGDESNNSSSQSGAAYVFTRNNTTWSQQAYLKASNTDAGDIFSESLILSNDGNTLAVGARYEFSNASGVNGDQTNNDYKNAGAAYVFFRDSENNWNQQAYLKASNVDAYDNFGGALGLSEDGNTLTIGAYYERGSSTGIGGNQDNNDKEGSGAVYTFTRENSTWTQENYLKSSNSEAYDYFGINLALSADANTLAVGAKYEDSNATGINGDQTDNSSTESGAVYLY